MSNLFLFIGQLHPILIHLPIGMLLSGICLFGYDQIFKNKNHQTGIEILVIFSAIFAMLSVITGLVLSSENQYDESLILKHQYLGITLTIFIVAFYFSLKTENSPIILKNSLALINVILIFFTGHYGGTITHGTLTFNVENIKSKKEYHFNDSSSIYLSMVQPILDEKCISCHGIEKQKGELRLDDYLNISKGGKTGHALDPYQNNEIVKRILLSADDKKHMPPKERTQLTAEESNIIHWWIRYGASEKMKLKEFLKNDTIIAFINNKKKVINVQSDIPKIENNILLKLSKQGVVVYPIEINSPYLYVNLQNTNIGSKTFIDDFSKIKSNIIELKINWKILNKEMIYMISNMEKLEKLDLSHSSFEDSIESNIIFPKQLKLLNISNSILSKNYISAINRLSGLDEIFIYNMKADSSSIQNLKNNKRIGKIHENEFVPTFNSDTTFVK